MVLQVTTMRPLDRDTITALRLVGRVLGTPTTYQLDGRFHFPLGGGWSLALSPDDAGRFRLGAFYGRTEVATLWCLEGDRRRLADLALGLRSEVAGLTRA
jgi:hypothetical protein